jgi:hypothetical protein
MRDKQAYVGLIIVLVGAALVGLLFLGKMLMEELREMPVEDANAEIQVDELRIHKAEEEEAILLGDSLAQAYNVDSIRRTVQIDTRSVYRPPRKDDHWYITQREWLEMWQSLRHWRKNKDKE